MNASNGFSSGSEAVVLPLPDPLTVLSGFINLLFLPLYALSTLAGVSMRPQLPPIAQQQQVSLPPIAEKTAPMTMTNEEKWEWVDYKGRAREITIHRKLTHSHD